MSTTPTWSSAAAPLQAAFDALARIPKPTVAAITGYALGGGCELALAARLPGLRRQRQARPAGDPARHHPRRRRHPAAAPADRPGPGEGPDLLRPVRRRRRGAARSAWSTRWSPPDDVLRRGGRAGRAVTPPARRWRCARRRRPSTAAWTATSPAGCELETAAVRRRCSRTEDRADRDGVVRRERPRQGGVRGPMTTALMSRCPTAERGRARAADDPKLANVLYHDWEAGDVRREVVDLVRRALHRPTPGTGSRTSPDWPAGRTRGRWRSAAAPASSCSTSCRPGVADAGHGDRPRPRAWSRWRCATPSPSASTSTGGSPTPRRSRTTTTSFDLVVGPRGAAPHPGRRAGAARGAAGAQAGRAVRVRRRADPVSATCVRPPAVPGDVVGRDHG